jgi:hypothetical protein
VQEFLREAGEILRITPPRIEHFKNRPCVSVSAAAGEREGRAERASGCRACGSHQTCLRLLPPRSRRERFSCLLTSAAHTAHTRARRVLTPGSVRREAEPRERIRPRPHPQIWLQQRPGGDSVPSRATRNQHAATREPQPARRCSHRSPRGTTQSSVNGQCFGGVVGAGFGGFAEAWDGVAPVPQRPVGASDPRRYRLLWQPAGEQLGGESLLRRHERSTRGRRTPPHRSVSALGQQLSVPDRCLRLSDHEF